MHRCLKSSRNCAARSVFFPRISQIIGNHRRWIFAGCKDVSGIFIESGFHIIQGQLQIIVGRPAHHALPILHAAADQGLFVAYAHIQRVNGRGLCKKRRRILVQRAQDGGLQSPGLHVVPVADHRLVNKLQSRRIVALLTGQTGQPVETAALGFVTPGSLVKCIKRLLVPAGHHQRKPQIKITFPVIGIGVFPGLFLNRPAEIRNALLKAASAEEKMSVGIV